MYYLLSHNGTGGFAPVKMWCFLMCYRYGYCLAKLALATIKTNISLLLRISIIIAKFLPQIMTITIHKSKCIIIIITDI